MRNSDLLSVTEFTQKLGFSKASKMSLPAARKIFEERLKTAPGQEERSSIKYAIWAIDNAQMAFEELAHAKSHARRALSYAKAYKKGV
jgi:hypothetical protein